MSLCHLPEIISPRAGKSFIFSYLSADSVASPHLTLSYVKLKVVITYADSFNVVTNPTALLSSTPRGFHYVFVFLHTNQSENIFLGPTVLVCLVITVVTGG